MLVYILQVTRVGLDCFHHVFDHAESWPDKDRRIKAAECLLNSRVLSRCWARSSPMHCCYRRLPAFPLLLEEQQQYVPCWALLSHCQGRAHTLKCINDDHIAFCATDHTEAWRWTACVAPWACHWCNGNVVFGRALDQECLGAWSLGHQCSCLRRRTFVLPGATILARL